LSPPPDKQRERDAAAAAELPAKPRSSSDRDRHKQREDERERDSRGDRHKDKERERDRSDRDKDRDRERDRDRRREREKQDSRWVACALLVLAPPGIWMRLLAVWQCWCALTQSQSATAGVMIHGCTACVAASVCRLAFTACNSCIAACPMFVLTGAADAAAAGAAAGVEAGARTTARKMGIGRAAAVDTSAGAGLSPADVVTGVAEPWVVLTWGCVFEHAHVLLPQ
jgi:hypothetical protein